MIYLAFWIIYHTIGFAVLWWDCRKAPLCNDFGGIYAIVVILLWPVYLLIYLFGWIRDLFRRLVLEVFG